MMTKLTFVVDPHLEHDLRVSLSQYERELEAAFFDSDFDKYKEVKRVVKIIRHNVAALERLWMPF